MPERKRLFETITAENWRKGAEFYQMPGKPGCILHHARLIGALQTPADCRAFFDALRLLYPERAMRSVTYFNDHPDTTIEDVIRVCKVADV